MEELKNQGPADIAIVVTGNKADLESQRVIYLLVDFLKHVFVILKFPGDR